ncbi:MAG: threonine synthase [candidate division KSB1 bacterium]|nr:threonine synthase [candidate division KSB1 bacterium]
MKLYSTRGQSPVVSFREALFAGQAPDGGLYMPVDFPPMPIEAIAAEDDFRAAAATAITQWLGDELTAEGVQRVTEQAFFFSPALSPLSDGISVLELFHGPTLSFKDFGAQFMAKCMGWFLRHENHEITILVATSGDTGSAVAHAFHRVEGIRIVLLYPSGKVSPLQERQFTTLGDNVHALEVDGTFDDCQALVKTAFRDAELTARARLSSANSINIGRLIPQSLYYLWAVTRFSGEAPVVCVPSGNFGNLCAGLFAEQCGLKVHRFIAAVNANAVIPEYLETGVPGRRCRRCPTPWTSVIPAIGSVFGHCTATTAAGSVTGCGRRASRTTRRWRPSAAFMSRTATWPIRTLRSGWRQRRDIVRLHRMRAGRSFCLLRIQPSFSKSWQRLWRRRCRCRRRWRHASIAPRSLHPCPTIMEL